MRIQIETLLIDLNEELFTLSDELARLYSHNPDALKVDQTIQKKISEFESRKAALTKKVS